MPLEYAVCQNCKDFLDFGPPVPQNERGWRKIK
jgi:hypothetical protein